MKLPTVLTPYWKNIDSRIPDGQRLVFSYLGIPLEQVRTDGESHGAWLTRMAKDPTREIIVFCDVDAFPLTHDAYLHAVDVAANGGLFGLAQVANQFDPDLIYAGPMFMAFSRKTYEKLGSPDLEPTPRADVAQVLTEIAEASNVEVNLAFPSTVISPRWPLAQKGVFGIGTFYGENQFFHLFESRFSKNVDLFEAVCSDVLSGRLNFSRYLELSKQQKSILDRLRKVL